MKLFNNNDFDIKDIGKKVNLKGWVSKKRNLGGLIFIDLRDRSGIIQLVVRPEYKDYKLIETIKSEYVLEVEGTVQERESKNLNIKTGEIEISVENIIILNESIDTPFEISEKATALEDTRLKYRYLDIRKNDIQSKLIIRHKVTKIIHNFLDKKDFIEVETPILTKSTPEGARDYLVPSRVNKNKFYALPQSPQIFKQLLMVGGIEKYYQIAKCFRDEDLRADRQPEFTQVDIEMSFIDENDIQNIIEDLFKEIFKTIKGIELQTPFLKMTYEEAINKYGSDKPDLRFDLPLNDITHIFKNNDFALLKDKEEINAIVVNASDKYSRKDLDLLEEFVKKYEAKNLLWLKYNDNELSGSISKNIENKKTQLINNLNLKDNDLVLIISDTKDIVKNSLGALRNKIAKDLNLIDENINKFLWVVDFPLLEYSDNRYYAKHHPFTSPKEEDLHLLSENPLNCRAKAYDIVLNGYELGGGSIRIHKKEIQQHMFELLGMSKEEINDKFGFLIEAFQYGTPPHGGIALGLDRLIMLLTNTENIRDVIAFPKTSSATCLMTDAPNVVDEKQLAELYIKSIKA
jgi:aspartyl-tRNA synthetase